ncbi:hypothetical protein Hdeb2414_s0013g00417611 [Helianthus debilis subsp. tardiflorus]
MFFLYFGDPFIQLILRSHTTTRNVSIRGDSVRSCFRSKENMSGKEVVYSSSFI